MKLAITIALALVAGAALADPLPHKPSIHTPPHRSLMRQHLNPWQWQRPSDVNAPLDTQQKVRRTRQQHRP
jgi:hypothetical protein